MGLKIKYEIKAILFGVDETIINNLKLGNSYFVEKASMTNNKLWEAFDYTAFGLRRMYEEAKLNSNLEVALLKKVDEVSYDNAVLIIDQGWFVDEKDIIDIIYDYETEQMNYVDEKMRIIRLFSENGFNIKELLINAEVINQENDEVVLNHNSKIPFPDRIIGVTEKLSLSNSDEIIKINNFISKVNLKFKDSKFSPKILSSAAFLYDQSYTSPVVTLRFMVGVIGLESLLVDGNSELSYRLSRNCAMLLSSNLDEYLELLTKMKKIYKKRSDYVHNGIVKSLEEKEVIEVRSILRNVIFRIIEKNISQDLLIKELDLKGYM